MAVYTEAIQKLYVAYFNRPADYEGLLWWEKIVTAAKGDTSAVSAAFAGSAEYKSTYAGMTNLQVVLAVYKNLFNESNPDMAGVDFWVNALNSKVITIDNVVAQIAAGAQSTHKDTYAAKVAAATAFTAALDTPAEAGGYIGDAANAAAKVWMSTINKDTVEAAITPASLATIIGTIIDNGPGSKGQTFSLTVGQDIITGTAGNDVINVNAFNATTGEAANTLSSFDSIDGGAGKDTLNIQIKDDGAVAAGNLNGTIPSVKNVEIVNLNLAEADLVAFAAVDASKFAGATAITQLGKAVTVNKLAATTTAGFDSTSDNMVINAAGATASVNFNKVAEAATLTVTGDALANVAIAGNRVDTDESGSIAALALTINAGEDVQTVKLTTNQTTTVTINEDADSVKKVTALDASASTAKVTFVGDGDIVSISTGAGGDAVTFNGATSAATTTAAAVNGTVSTGAGKDTIVVNGSGDGVISVDAGASDDSITVNKAAGLGLNVQAGDGNDTVVLAGAALATTDVINGGAGTDTVSVAGAAARVADDFIVFNKLLTGFETIKFSSAEGTTTALDASKLAANYTTIDLFTGSFVSKVGTQAVIVNGTATVSAAGYGVDPDAPRVGTLTITEKTNAGAITANAEIVNLTVKANTANVTASLAGDFKTANVTTTNSVNSSTNPTADTIAKLTIDSAAAAAMTSLTLTGNGSAQVTNSDAGKLTTIDASGLGGAYTLGDNAGKAIAGLTLVSDEKSAETIKLGAGIDVVTLNASKYGAVDSVSGLKLVLNTAGTALTASSDQLHVGAGATYEKMTTTQTDLDLALKDAAASAKDNLVFQMGGDTYVYQDVNADGKVDAGDVVVKLVGAIDLDALIVALKPVV